METNFRVYKNPNIDTSKVASRFKKDKYQVYKSNSDPTLNNVAQMQSDEQQVEQNQEVNSNTYITEKLLPDIITNSKGYEVASKGLATVQDVGLDLAKGIFKFFEGIGDFVGTGAATIGDALGADTTGLRELIQRDLSEKYMNSKWFSAQFDPIGTFAGKYDNQSYVQAQRDASYLNEAPQIIQEGVHGVAQSIGEMLPSIAVGGMMKGAGVSAKLAEAGQLGLFGLGAAGNASEQAINEGASNLQALGYGALSGATEVATEKIFDVFGFFGGGVADKIIAKGGKPFKIVAGLLGEGVEEVLSDLAAPEWKKIVGMAETYQENAPSFADLAESFALGSITSMIMGGASTANSIARYSSNGTKYLSLSEDLANTNEAVNNEIDRVIKDRVTKEQWKELQNDSQAYNNLVAEVMDELDSLKHSDAELPKVYRNIQELIDSKNKIIEKMNNLLYNMSDEKAQKIRDIKVGTITEENGQKRDYTLGEEIYKNSIDISDINNHNVTFDKGVNVVGKANISNNQVSIDELSDQNFSNKQKVQANRIARAVNEINSKFKTNYDVVFTDGLVGGKDVKLNGANDRGTFYININSKKALLKTTMHELTHSLENTNVYEELAKYTKESMGEEAFEKAKSDRKATYTDLNQGDNDTLEQEVVADAVGDMFDTYEDVKKLVSANDSLARKIKNWIARKFNQSKGDTVLRSELKPAYEMINKALSEKTQKSEQNVTKLEKKIAFDGIIRFDAINLRSWDKEKLISNAVDTLYNIEKNGKYYESKAAIRTRVENYYNDMLDVASIMDDYGISYSPSEVGSAIKSNGDYIYSMDLSTICAKRLQMQEVWDKIVKENSKAFNDPRSFFKLLEIMHSEGLTTPCGICFVESRRKILGEMTTKFLNCKKGNFENKSSNKYKAQQEILKYEEQTQKTLTADQLLDSTSLEEIRMEFPDLYSIYNSFYGAIKPKLSEKPTSFKFGVIKSIFTDKNGNINHKLVEEVNNHGGFRMLSFSDFQVEHAIDFMQAILECDSLGLKVQAYTKVPEFAKLVKGTNIKLNLSLVLMQDKNGNFDFSSKEGMDVEVAKQLRKTDANIGTIAVGPDILTSLKLIGMDFIDYIIPFHRSAISMTAKNGQVSESHRLGLTGYVDFTNFQNEKKGVLGKNKTQENVPQEAYWSYNVSGNENSKRYIQYCVKNNIKPKFYDVFLAPTIRDSRTGKPTSNAKSGISFEQFLNQNNIKYEKFTYKNYDFIIPDGYWKSLGDYRNYDGAGKAVPQVPVKANFDKATWEELLRNYKSPRLKMSNGKYVSEGELTSVENKVVNNFLEAVKNNDLNSDLYGKPLSSSIDTNKIRYSVEDSDGNKLSEQQVEFFKDSKARDSEGNLLNLYHGTRSGGFMEFLDRPIFLSDNYETASGYGLSDNPVITQTFDNIDDLVNYLYGEGDEVLHLSEKGIDFTPIEENEDALEYRDSKIAAFKERGINDDHILIKNLKNAKYVLSLPDTFGGYFDYRFYNEQQALKEVIPNIQSHLSENMEDVLESENINSVYQVYANIKNPLRINCYGNSFLNIKYQGKEMSTDEIAEKVKSEGKYDGIIFKNIMDNGERDFFNEAGLSNVYVVFNSNQVKATDNFNPSENNDIRYSVSDELSMSDYDMSPAEKKLFDALLAEIDNESQELETEDLISSGSLDDMYKKYFYKGSYGIDFITEEAKKKSIVEAYKDLLISNIQENGTIDKKWYDYFKQFINMRYNYGYEKCQQLYDKYVDMADKEASRVLKINANKTYRSPGFLKDIYQNEKELKKFRASGKTASFTQERLEKEYRRSYAQFDPLYARSYVTYMSPQEFLELTLHNPKDIGTGVKSNEEHLVDLSNTDFSAENVGKLDEKELRRYDQVIYLQVEEKTGEVKGHEGRHRMFALMKAGYTNVQVVIEFRTHDGWIQKRMEALKIPKVLKGQTFKASVGRTTSLEIPLNKEQLMPLNLGNLESVIEATNKVKSDIRYSVDNHPIPTNALEETSAEVDKISRQKGIEDTKNIDSNYVKGKANYDNDAVYNKNVASKLLDKSLINVFKEQNGKTIAIKGNKDKIINYIFQELNKTKLEDIISGQANDSMANKLADYIIKNISTNEGVLPVDKTALVNELSANIQEAYLQDGKIAGYKAMKEKLSNKIVELKTRLRWNKRLVVETRKLSKAINTFKTTTNRKYSNNPSAKPLDKMFTPAVDILKKLRLTNFYTQEARSIMQEYRTVFYNENNEMLKDDYSQMIVDMIDSITSGSGNLDIYEMNTLVNIYQSLNKLMKYYDNVVFEDRVEKASEVAKQLETDIASGRSINKNIKSTAFNSIQKPRLVLRQFDGSFGDKDNSLTNLVYGELRKAEDTFKKNDTTFREKILDFESKHKKFTERMFKETVDIKGKKIPLGEAITIYQWSRREQARGHFMSDVNPVAQGINIYSQKNGNFLGTFTLTQEDIDKLQGGFDSETQEYIKFIDGLIEEAKVLKEETDYKALGFTNAIDDFYFPIMTDSMYNSYKNFGDVRNVKAIDSVLGLSMNKNVVTNANNKLRLQNAYDIVNRHLNQASKYNAYYVTIKAIQKALNTYTENKTTAKQSLMGLNPDIIDYIDNLIIDVADVRQHESKMGEQVSSFLRGNLATANLGLNLKVMFNQLSSIPTALSILSPTSIAKSYKMGIGKNAANEMDKYCRYTYYRNFYNTKVMSEIYRSDSNTIVDSGYSKVRQAYHKVQNLVMRPISFMDRRAMVRLWNACQVEVEAKQGLKLGTEENKVKAAELLEKVVRETQPDYSPLEAPTIKKSRSELVRWMTMFTTQPLQNLNQIIEASNDIKNIKSQIKANGTSEELTKQLKQANRKLMRNVSSVMAANLMYTLIALGFKQLLGKRKEDEGIAKEFIVDFMGSNVGMIPIVREIYNKLFNNYDISADPLGAVNDFIDATKSIYNNVSSGNYQGLWYKLSKALSTLTGIPFKNINEYSMTLIGAFSPATAYKYRSIWYNKTISSFTDDLEKAIAKKDDSQINTIIQALYSKKGITLDNNNIKELNKLSKASTKNIITLKNVTSTATINGETVEINDTSKIKKYYSDNVNTSLSSLIKNAYYAGLSKEEKAYAIKLSNDASYYKALTKALNTDIKENKINLLTKAFFGNSYYTLIAALSKCKNSLKGNKQAIQKYINSLRLSKEQKYILYGLAGYKPLNDNASTQVSNYLTAKGYTKEMREYIMDFAKLL